MKVYKDVSRLIRFVLFFISALLIGFTLVGLTILRSSLEIACKVIGFFELKVEGWLRRKGIIDEKRKKWFFQKGVVILLQLPFS